MEIDLINHPPHYQAIFGGNLVCNDITGMLPFNLGNIVKYAWRVGLKGGREGAVSDAGKIGWYLDAYMHQVINEATYKCYEPILKDARKKFRGVKDVLHTKELTPNDILLHAKYKFIRDVLAMNPTNTPKKVFKLLASMHHLRMCLFLNAPEG